MNIEDQEQALEFLRSIAQCAIAAQEHVRKNTDWSLHKSLECLSDILDDADRAENLIVKHIIGE